MKNTVIKTLKSWYMRQSADAGGAITPNQQEEHTSVAKVPANPSFRMHPLQVWASPHFFYHLSSLNEHKA